MIERLMAFSLRNRLAVGLLVAAKLVGTGLVARIFLITRPQLMRIVWFAHLYGLFMPWDTLRCIARIAPRDRAQLLFHGRLEKE